MRLAAIAIGVMLVFSGCSEEKPSYSPDALNDMLRPKDGMAKLVVYYPRARIWSDTVADVTVQGTEACRLKSGSFMLYDVPTGADLVSVSLCNGNGITQMKVHADAGHIYYLQVIPRDQSIAGLIAGHGIKMTENPDEPEPLRLPPKPTDAEITAGEIRRTHAEGTAFYLDRMDAQSAMKLLESLKLAKE